MITRIKLIGYLCCLMVFSTNLYAQKETPAQQFWNQLKSHCGKAYQGTLQLPENDKDFGGKKLVMHIRACNDSIIKIPFFVGEDKSRTWIFSLKNDRITLKHDHRHKDGSNDKISFYGGTTTNVGTATTQVFSADSFTQQMIPAAATNVWWVTLNDKEFTYNLRRLGSNRVFKVVMDITKSIQNPTPPWGWNNE